jgi:hypothetical protein
MQIHIHEDQIRSEKIHGQFQTSMETSMVYHDTPRLPPSQAPALQALVVCARRGDLAQLSNHAMLRQKVLTLEAIELGGG